MPADIRSLVKKMIADGESEDVIKAVIKKMDATEDGSDIKSGLPDMSPAPPDRDEYTGPDTFWGGVKNSLFGKEFDETARKSLKGFAKGAADIPATFADTAQGLASGVHSLIQDPAAHFRAMPEAFREMGRGMRDVTMNAGADPEAFGHMSGQIFGQPAFTEGLIRAPAISKATTGAINRIPAVNKTFSSVGKALEGTRDPKILPASSRGLVAGAVRGAARPIGRALQRVGERGRLDVGTRPPSPRTNIKLKGETETPHSPDSDIFAGGGEGAVRPRPVRNTPTRIDQNTEFTRPILESAEELAARRRPSAFTGGQSRRNQSTPFEPRPVDTTPYPQPGEIPPGIPGEAPLVRDTTPYEPPPVRPRGLPPEPPPIDPLAAPPPGTPPIDVTKAPRRPKRKTGVEPQYPLNPAGRYPVTGEFEPPLDLTRPIGVGEGGQSSRYQSRPFEFGQEPIGELGLPPQPKTRTPAPVEPPARPFEPSVDPAANFTPEDLALMQSRKAEMRAALEKMASGELVDPLTGEITTPKRTKGPWRQSESNEEMGFFGPEDPPSIADDAGRQFADDVEATRYPGDEAYDLGEVSPGFRSSSSMPDWGPPAQSKFGRGGVADFKVPNKTALDPGFDMAKNSAARAKVNELKAKQASGTISESEVSLMEAMDSYLSKNQMPPADVVPFQPRTIAPEEWGDWGGLEADIPTLVPDASGSHVAAPRPGVSPLRPEVPPGQVTNRSMFQLSEQRAAEGLPNPGREFADSIAPNEFSEDMMFTPSELEPSAVPPPEASPFENQFDPRISGLEPAGDILEGASPEFTSRRNPGAADDSNISRTDGLGDAQITTPKGKDATGLIRETDSPVIQKAIVDWIDSQEFVGSHRGADRNKIVDRATGMTEEDVLDLISVRKNQARVSKMPQGGDFSKSFTDTFTGLRGQFDRVVGYNEGAVSVRLKNGSHVSIGRDDISGVALPTGRDYNTSGGGKSYSQTVMNPDRFNEAGDFVGNTPQPPRPEVPQTPGIETLRLTGPDEAPNLQPQFPNRRVHGETAQFEKPEWFNVDDDFGIANDDPLEGASPTFGKGKLVKKGGPAREKNFPSIIPEGFGKVGGRPVGPKGASYTVKDPNGKKLGDINVTPKDIAALKADTENYGFLDDGEIAEMIYQDRKEALLGKHGYYADEPKISIEPKTTRTKDVQVPAEPKAPVVTKLPPAGEAQMMGQEPTYSEATPTPARAKSDKRPVKPTKAEPPLVINKQAPFDPNKAFGRDGDLKPITAEFARLQRINADDAKYGELLPDDLLTGPLEPGQTYKQKVQEALKTVDDLEGSNARRNPEKETADWNERQQVLADLRNKLKIGELDDFTNRVIEMSRLDPEPIHAPLDPSKVDVSKLRPGKINQHSGKLWQSPKMQQQQNAIFRERMGKPAKKAKDRKKAKWL